MRSTFAVRETASLGTIDSEGFKGGTRGSPIMPRDAVSRTANVERTGRHKWVKLSNGSGYKTPFEKKSFHFSFTFHGKKSESNFNGTEKSNGKYLFNIFTAYYYLGKKYLNPLGEVIFKILWKSTRRKINSWQKNNSFLPELKKILFSLISKK